MPRKAAGEHALRTVRIRRVIASSAFAAATLALAAGCSTGNEGPTACCAYTGSPVVVTIGVPPSPSPTHEPTQPPATASECLLSFRTWPLSWEIGPFLGV